MFIKTLKTSVVIGAVILSMSGVKSATIDAETIDTSEEQSNSGTVTASVLNVRSGGSMQNEIIDQVINGDQVNILSYSNGWYEVEYSGNTGWSYGKYIDASNSEEYSSSTSEENSESSETSSNNSYLEKSDQDNEVSEEIIEETEEDSYSSSGNAMSFTATAYSGDGITSTGTVPRYGTIAVDPSVIPYGSKVYIHELGQTFTAEDCGGAIKGNIVDIYMNSESECNNWGRRSITLEIVE